jgi:ribonuclease VapC
VVVDTSALIAVLLGVPEVAVEPFTQGDARAALDAWRRFGNGRHPAGLNLGGCFAYAVAARRGDSLVFVGDDFAHTDVRPALGA